MLGLGRIVRRFVRRITKPIEESKAELWKKRLAITYAIVAWHAFGFVCYYVATGRSDWALYYGLKPEEEAEVRPGVFYAKLLGIKKATIVRMHGFNKVDELEYDADTYVPPHKQNKENVDSTDPSNISSEE